MVFVTWRHLVSHEFWVWISVYDTNKKKTITRYGKCEFLFDIQRARYFSVLIHITIYKVYNCAITKGLFWNFIQDENLSSYWNTTYQIETKCIDFNDFCWKWKWIVGWTRTYIYYMHMHASAQTWKLNVLYFPLRE